VKVLMGHAAFPGWLTMETRKSSGICASAAAALTASSVGLTHCPAALRSSAEGSLF